MSKEDVYGAIIDYYGDIVLKQIKNVDGWVVYAARVHSGLSMIRYIFAIVKERLARKEQVTLNELDWSSFQTRISDEIHQVPTHHLYLDENRKKALDDLLSVMDRDSEKTVYSTTSLPIRVILLHDPKKNNYLQYPDKCRLYQALETFRCVIELL